MGLLDGHNAVITGGAQGIGFEIAGVLGAEGASVVLGDINADAAAEAAERLAKNGVAATSLRCDVTDEDEVAALVAHCTDTFGPVGVMVNNAGITRDATLRKMALADFRAVVDVHLTGAWNGTRYAAEAMRAHGRGGSIVNISSIAARSATSGRRTTAPPRRDSSASPRPPPRARESGHPRQRRAARSHPHRHDRGDAQGRLGRETRRDPDGPRRLNPPRSPRPSSSSPPAWRATSPEPCSR